MNQHALHLYEVDDDGAVREPIGPRAKFDVSSLQKYHRRARFSRRRGRTAPRNDIGRRRTSSFAN